MEQWMEATTEMQEGYEEREFASNTLKVQDTGA
jgi:hypothetical protein